MVNKSIGSMLYSQNFDIFMSIKIFYHNKQCLTRCDINVIGFERQLLSIKNAYFLFVFLFVLIIYVHVKIFSVMLGQIFFG